MKEWTRPGPWHKLCLVLVGLITTLGPTNLAFSRRAKLTPAKIKQIKKTNKSFKQCRKDALAQLKKGGMSKERFALALSSCQEKFPGASLYTQCKRKALLNARRQNISPEQELFRCRRFLLAASFDPKERLPLFVHNGQMYFAGSGMNRTTPLRSLPPPNFNCSRLNAVARNPEKAQYILFGNHPRTFAGLAGLPGPALRKLLHYRAAPRKQGQHVPGLGQLYGSPLNPSGALFFPTAPCDFEGVLGKMFSGISTYYLIDSASSSATPYFGIAYFKKDQKTARTEHLVRGLLRQLGKNFQVIRKNPLASFVAAAPLNETDEEQDPKNLCAAPRLHRFVGVVQARRENPSRPEYLILANIKNLCTFGDRIGKRLTR